MVDGLGSTEHWKLVKLDIPVNKRVLNGVHKVHRDGILFGLTLLGALAGMVASVFLFAFSSLASVESIYVFCVILLSSLIFLSTGMFIMNNMSHRRDKYIEQLAHEVVKRLADEGWVTTFDSSYQILKNRQGGSFTETVSDANYSAVTVTISEENRLEVLFALDDKEAERTARNVKAKNQAVTALEIWKSEHPNLDEVTIDEAFMAGVTWKEG